MREKCGVSKQAIHVPTFARTVDWTVLMTVLFTVLPSYKPTYVPSAMFECLCLQVDIIATFVDYFIDPLLWKSFLYHKYNLAFKCHWLTRTSKPQVAATERHCLHAKITLKVINSGNASTLLIVQWATRVLQTLKNCILRHLHLKLQV